jgi:hypothetical protein
VAVFAVPFAMNPIPSLQWWPSATARPARRTPGQPFR